MAPIRKNTINHFTHPAHKLTEIKSNEEYNCDGCKLDGNGTRFNCSQCEFDLHEHCAMYPMTLTSDKHPLHPLSLVVYVHNVSVGIRFCRECWNPVEGLVYQCSSKDCSFIVHPGCANSSSSDTPPRTITTYNNYNTREQRQGATATGSGQAGGARIGNIAEQVGVGIHFTHPAHKLTEIRSNKGYNCDGCKLDGNGTRFNCSQCEFNLHEHCAKCPMTLTSDKHPLHPLNLVRNVSVGIRYCRECWNPVKGLVYQCSSKDCLFIVHPGCANSSSSVAPPRTTTTTYNNYNTRELRQGAPATGSRQSGREKIGKIAKQFGLGMATNAAYDWVKSFVTDDDVQSAFTLLFENI